MLGPGSNINKRVRELAADELKKCVIDLARWKGWVALLRTKAYFKREMDSQGWDDAIGKVTDLSIKLESLSP